MTLTNMTPRALAVACLFALGACGADGPSGEHVEPTSAESHAGQPDVSATETHADHDETSSEAAHDEGGKAVKLSAQEIQEEGIRVESILPRKIDQVLTLTAVIEANRDRLAHVAPRVPARIVKVTANLGDRVSTGQALATLDSSDVGEAHAAYLQARSELGVSRAAYDRAEKLQLAQIIAQKEFLRVRGDFERAQAAFHAAEDRLRMLGVDVKSAADDKAVSMFPLRSPFTGTVIEKHAILGELADPEKSLFTIADLSTLWIEADLYEKDLGRVKAGSAAEIEVAAYPDIVFRGKLTYVSDVMDAKTRTVKARIEVPNAERRLKPQMFANARIGTTTQREVIALPVDAVTLIEGRSSVFVQEHDAFEARVVSTGDRLGEMLVITGGLAPEDRVVVEGTFALKARMLKSALGEGHAH
jgi:membrane fusion protein, heavy metal efflux system